MGKLISDKFAAWQEECEQRFQQLKANEEELNRIFIDIYGLQDELTPEVEDKDVTVRRADLTREINAYNGAHQDATRAFLTAAHDLFMELTGVLNLVQKRDDAVDPDAEKIEELIAQRAAAKKAKDFAEADRIRGVLADMGVTIKDTRQGTQWSRS